MSNGGLVLDADTLAHVAEGLPFRGYVRPCWPLSLSSKSVGKGEGGRVRVMEGRGGALWGGGGQGRMGITVVFRGIRAAPTA